ncbi:hypothetical protein [Rhizobium lentis]|uniref:hypothetical protein n=1 Tax=Rhizobium lentis TaxID=1138194 RepID=UPI001C82E115|nr:hypothetical protein [Rhizobium lentis]MBX5046974.1 hypothetical protein [Rhizobium lentis]MBX5058986.1 hypothetical protein [Rhizobium lentis]
MSVAQGEGQDVGLKLEALKLIRKVEAKRVVPGTAKAIDTAQAMALGKRVATAKRRLELVRKKEWPAQKGWANNLGEVRGIVVEEERIAERLEAARENVLRQRPANN